MECDLSIQGIEGIGGIHEEYCFVFIRFKGRSNGVDCSFNSRELASAELEASSGVLYIWSNNGENSFGNYLPGSVPNTYRAHAWFFYPVRLGGKRVGVQRISGLCRMYRSSLLSERVNCTCRRMLPCKMYISFSSHVHQYQMVRLSQWSSKLPIVSY